MDRRPADGHINLIGRLVIRNPPKNSLMSGNENVDGQTDEQTDKQEGQGCPKRRVAQAAIKLATTVITFKNKKC